MGQLIDWHTHCWLPEHRSKDDQELWKLRGVLGTEATMEGRLACSSYHAASPGRPVRQPSSPSLKSR